MQTVTQLVINMMTMNMKRYLILISVVLGLLTGCRKADVVSSQSNVEITSLKIVFPNETISYADMQNAVLVDGNTTQLTAIVPVGADLTNVRLVVAVPNNIVVKPSLGVVVDLTKPYAFVAEGPDGTQKKYVLITKVEKP